MPTPDSTGALLGHLRALATYAQEHPVVSLHPASPCCDFSAFVPLFGQLTHAQIHTLDPLLQALAVASSCIVAGDNSHPYT